METLKERTHSVIIFFHKEIDELDTLHSLAIKLDKLIEKEGVGEYDGHEIAIDNSHGSLYMYGPNAEVLFKTVKPLLDKINFLRGATAQLKFGNTKDASEIEVTIGE